MRTSFHHQPEAQHPKSPAIETPAGRLPHLSATNGLMHRSKFAVIARTFIALSCLVAGQEFMQLSALRLRRMMWREVSSAIAPELSSCVIVRDTVSMVSPR